MSRALLVIDVQESFRTRPDWADMHNPDIATPVGRLVDAARSAGELVVWVLHSEPGTGTVFDPQQGHVQVLSELKPDGDEPVVVKTSVNAFTTTNLQQLLMQHGVREVVICGIRTEQCCETTARVAGDLGFDVTFVTDATTTSGIPGLSAEQIIERTESVLRAREFATIATTDELTGA
ncbi:MAG TPA: cysteine hydrolase family protein [Jatrophihabitans sp.]|jgi:nicotinamidase-related amidase